MLRLLFLLAFLSYPAVSSTDAGTRDPLTRSHELIFQNANQISPLVKQRFKLFVAMSRCDYTDNQYAFNFALDKFAKSDQWVLRKAAEDGWAEGQAAAATATGSCEAAIDGLRAADDALLARAETLPNP